MAKEFKDWDKHFSRAQLDACREQWQKNLDRRAADQVNPAGIAEGIGFWVYHGHYTTYPQEVVADAVYASGDVTEWQRFRVMLKGLSTHKKLAFLEARWDIYVRDNVMGSKQIEMIRINNYIGALRRGGQLDGDFNVVK